MERGLDVNARDGIEGSNQTPLMCAAGQSGDHPLHEKHVSIVRLLLEQPSIEVNLAGNIQQLEYSPLYLGNREPLFPASLNRSG